MKRFFAGGSGAAFIFLTLFNLSPSQAQDAPRRLRGTIERIDGATLAIKARDGSALTVKLKENAPVTAIVSATLADIKPGTYVGIAAMPQPDGSQRALEVHIFPESMRGVGDGHRPWDLQAESTMTNGNVEQQAAGVEGQTLKVKYKDGEKNVSVPSQTQIVAFQPAAASDLKAGQKIFIGAATKLADGSYEAARIAFGKDGLTPPM
jgi:Domain of unknown function (DUF5666)